MAKTQSLRLRTGITGLDDILWGGLPAGHVYLIEGDPGSGKTTMGLQFLLQGVANGEPTLYVTLAESREELETVAESHGFDILKVEIFEVKPPELDQTGSDQYTVFHPSEVELVDVMQNILSKMEKTKAGRIVFDSMSEIRMLARDPLVPATNSFAQAVLYGTKMHGAAGMQPTWSDFPLIILISPARDRESRRPGWPLFECWEM